MAFTINLIFKSCNYLLSTIKQPRALKSIIWKGQTGF